MTYDHQEDPTVVYVSYTPDKGEPGGFFDITCPDRIYLNSDNGLYESECVYWHEDGHRRCHKKKCFCWDRTSDFWAEYHAFKYEFEKVMASESEMIHKCYIRSLVRAVNKYSKYPKIYPTHLKALKKVFKLKAFKEFARPRRLMKLVNRVVNG